ncbi:MAG TPA: phenylalanine--tRNA ligase beta subunit-related protein [Syntrophorhabdaceae bacterium]|nr:phenylalanine--tRNA ligase beta subunit-related protein [Syntrophorhabdaceae bacterium]HPU30523.1 phenylalanine--tRNA ligase beta subunit-related protein [Syntrophorhabdaceae bacterium]
MQFSVEGKLFDIFPGLKIGVFVCEVDNTKYGEDRLGPIIKDLTASFSYDKPQDHPHIVIWRDAFKKIGISASKYYSSIEALLRRVLKSGEIPRINPVVDIYNSISLKYLVPMGGHALEPIDGNIYLAFAQGNEPFYPMDSGELETVEKNEVVYKDEKEVLTRRWVWRQCNKDKVTEETKRVFIPVDLMEGLSDDIWENIAKDLEKYLTEDRLGKIIHMDLLTKYKNTTEF